MMAFKGSVTVLVDGFAFRLKPGRAILCFPFQQHSFIQADQDRAWLFTTFELSNAEALIHLKNRAFRPGRRCWETAKDLARSFLSGKRPDRTCLLTGLLLDEMAQAGRGTRISDAGEPDLKVLETANRHIYDSIGEPLEIRNVAQACGVSASHLRFLFRSKFDRSIGRFIRETKINRARDLLATTEMTVTEVAEACGFDSLYAFSRSFKNFCQIPPTEYRRQALSREL